MQARRITGWVIGTALSVVFISAASAESPEEMRRNILKGIQEMRRNAEVAEQKQRQEREQWEAKARLPDIASTVPPNSSVAGAGVAIWTRVDSAGRCIDVNFQSNGTLLYQYDDGQRKGAWIQDGNTVHMLCDKKNCIERGVINGQRMEGETQNRSGDVYTWVAELNPEAGDCHSRVHFASLKQRAALTKDQINRAKQAGWATSNRAAEFEAAKAAVNRGEDVVGFRKMISIAEAGDAKAQYFMGDKYASSIRISGYYEPNVAVKWYRMAAAQGHPEAENDLGTMYHEGKGVTRDYTLALKWYLFADADGNKDAPFNIGLLYEYGLGVTKDLNQALGWYRKAEARGNAGASDKLDDLDVANKKVRFAAKTQPSSKDIAKMVAARLAKYTTRGRLDPDHPDTLIQELSIVGQVGTAKINVQDLNCSKNGNSKSVSCNFSVFQENANGPFAEILNAFAMKRTYTMEFIKGAEEWTSPQLDARIRAMGQSASTQARTGFNSGNGDTGGYPGSDSDGSGNSHSDTTWKEIQRREQAARDCPRQNSAYICNP